MSYDAKIASMARPLRKVDLALDLFGQHPGLQLYTQILFAFALPDGIPEGHVTGTLEKGLQTLAQTFPWTAGAVVNEGQGDGNTGIFKIATLADTPGLVVKDLRHDAARSLKALQDARFPARLLDEAFVAPRQTLPVPEEEGAVMPVFVVQASFVEGGLLLCFVGHHCAMDMTGLGQVIRLLSKACSGEEFTAEERMEGSRDRAHLLDELLLEAEDIDVGDQILAPPVVSTNDPANEQEPTGEEAAVEEPECSWSYFNFTASALAALKQEATATLPPTTPFISTDDALTALVWQSVTRARASRLPPTERTTLGRAVDARRYLAISPLYPGLLNNLVYETHTVASLQRTPLGALAASLRAAVDPSPSSSSPSSFSPSSSSPSSSSSSRPLSSSQVRQRTLATAALLARTPDKSAVDFMAAIAPHTDVALSSWAKEGPALCGLAFGMGLGPPVAVRRPAFVPFEGLAYFMPRAREGDVAVLVCLRKEDLALLREDEVFARCASFVG
jgi:hypothetical protein